MPFKWLKPWQEAHNNDIVHRDIKSENIMITPNGQVKLMDFGLAKLKGTTTLTRDGSTMGTIAYMSPEQTQGENVDQRTDIWSFGVVLYEMIAGQLPFKGDYDQAVIYSILNEEPRPMASLRDGVPLELERIANKCLKKRADERYQQVVEFARDLRQASDPNPPKKTVRIHPKKYGSRFRAKALMPVAGTLVIFIALISFLLSEKFDLNDARRDKKPIMLAVLPFDNLGNPEDAAFADGITDEILTKLSTIPELGVIARESAFKYRGDENTIEEIGEQLGVSYLLRGSIRWQRISEGNSRVRITSRLVSISENRNIWTGNL
ncbi:protein kinase [candidate division KSB1 bacterium]|nr:protein kinase [candidate division KSB1 bacterium]